MSNIIELYNLEGEFDETFRQYKQSYGNYISTLKNPNSQYTILDNTDSSRNNINSIQNSSVNNCEAVCSANSACYGFAFDSNNMCFIKNNSAFKTQTVEGSEFYIKNKNIQSNIVIYNEKLIILNQKIIKLLKSMQPDVNSLHNENKSKLVQAKKMSAELLQERKKIQDITDENLTITTGNNFFETYFQYQYAQYLFWCFLLIIVLLIILKSVFSPDVESNPVQFIGWSLLFAFIVITSLYSYVPAGFLILCLIIAYICLGFLKIVPIP